MPPERARPEQPPSSPPAFVYYEEPPVRLSMPEPRYTDEARRAGVEGVVRVRALIGVDGRVQETRIVRSVSPLLDEPALETVRASVWKPALNDERPVAVRVEIPVSFRLK